MGADRLVRRKEILSNSELMNLSREPLKMRFLTFAARSQERRSGKAAAATDRRGCAESEKLPGLLEIKGSRLVNEEGKKNRRTWLEKR